MCLILFALNVHPRFPLIVAANRDEFRTRPTLSAGFWDDRPAILAGKDLSAGGTWMGVTLAGRFAAVTNHRDLRRSRPVGPLSRGRLVLDALEGEPDLSVAHNYDGYNLLWGDAKGLTYHSNVSGRSEPVPSGVHGLSNHLLDTPWPKVVRSKETFEEVIRATVPESERLFDLLKDATLASDAELPDTGVGLEKERMLSAPFIDTEDYGTRCSTVIFFAGNGGITFEERDHRSNTSVHREFAVPIGS